MVPAIINLSRFIEFVWFLIQVTKLQQDNRTGVNRWYWFALSWRSTRDFQGYDKIQTSNWYCKFPIFIVISTTWNRIFRKPCDKYTIGCNFHRFLVVHFRGSGLWQVKITGTESILSNSNVNSKDTNHLPAENFDCFIYTMTIVNKHRRTQTVEPQSFWAFLIRPVTLFQCMRGSKHLTVP